MIIAAVFEWRDAALAIGLLGRESLASLGELYLLGRVYVHHVLQLLLELLVVLRGLPQQLLDVLILLTCRCLLLLFHKGWVIGWLDISLFNSNLS